MSLKKSAVPSISAQSDGLSYSTIGQPPNTAEERLVRIRALGQRIAGYVNFMCELGASGGASGGTSAEARERALIGFYQHLLVAERQLGKIQRDHELE